MTRQDVLDTIAIDSANLRSMGVKSLGLFGSYARDEAEPGSDIDLLVEFEAPFGLLKLAAVQVHLEDLLGCPVDLVPKRLLRPELRAQVLAEVLGAA